MGEIADCDDDEFRDTYNSQFRIGSPIFIYDETMVAKKKITQMHIRGSSRKEQSKNIDESLIAFFLHEESLYCWK